MSEQLHALSVGQVVSGFRLLKTEEVPALRATVYTFIHDKSGAELLYSARPDDNKTFAVAFETLPENDTGVFHILEHSVLNGSERFPVREPFVNMLQSSMQTFLNAMTFGDKTVYPVSSRNEKDFFNLMRVYLDAVFNPKIYSRPEIFMQEGWHYVMESPTAVPSYNGVVYSEMKGVFSNVDDAIDDLALNLTFPDTCYRYCAGGAPKHIPELTYEEFIRTHERFYHPNNAKFFLDGHMDVSAVLSYIDKEYLCRYDRREPDFHMQEQKPVRREAAFIYQAPLQGEGLSHYAFTKILCKFDDFCKIGAAHVLCDYLTGSNEAPLKRAVLESGLAQDVLAETVDGIYQPYVCLKVRNTAEQQQSAVAEVLQKAVERILAQGLDKEALTASLERYAFNSREIEEPRGVHLCVRALDSWLYGGNPTALWDSSPTVEELRKKAESSYFSDLLQELFGNMAAMSVLEIHPSATKGEEDLAEEKAAAEAAYASWDERERQAVSEAYLRMSSWQQTADSPQALATLPGLSIEDVEPLPKKTTVERLCVEGSSLVRVTVDTNGIVYANLCFSVADFSVEELQQASVLSSVLGLLPTEKYNAFALQNQIKTYFGSLHASVDVLAEDGVLDGCKPYFTVSVSMLEENVKEALALLQDVLCNSRFSEMQRIYESLLQDEYLLKQSVISSGHSYAVTRALSDFSSEGALKEQLEGESFVRWFSLYTQAFAADQQGKAQCLEKLYKRIVDASRLTVGYSGNVEPSAWKQLIGGLPRTTYEDMALRLQPSKEGKTEIAIPSGVSYSAVGHNLHAMKQGYTGDCHVLSSLLSFSYLWNAVRVQGGAYGTGMSVRPNGDVFCYSYRDPAVSKTVEVYHAMPHFLQEFCRQEPSIQELIIGTVNVTDPLLSPQSATLLELKRALKGVSYEDVCRIRQEVLHTSLEDLKRLISVLEALAKQGKICVIKGNNQVE